MPKMPSGKYQLTALCGGVAVLRQGFDDPNDANSAVAEVLASHPNCEIRLTQGDRVLISAAPAALRRI